MVGYGRKAGSASASLQKNPTRFEPATVIPVLTDGVYRAGELWVP
jgi:hypothetical protein